MMEIVNLAGRRIKKSPAGSKGANKPAGLNSECGRTFPGTFHEVIISCGYSGVK